MQVKAALLRNPQSEDMEPARGWESPGLTVKSLNLQNLLQNLWNSPQEWSRSLEFSPCSTAFPGAAQAVSGHHSWWVGTGLSTAKALVSPTAPQPQSCQILQAISITPYAPFSMGFLQHFSQPLSPLSAHGWVCTVQCDLAPAVSPGVLLGDPSPPTRCWGSTLSNTLSGQGLHRGQAHSCELDVSWLHLLGWAFRGRWQRAPAQLTALFSG